MATAQFFALRSPCLLFHATCRWALKNIFLGEGLVRAHAHVDEWLGIQTL